MKEKVNRIPRPKTLARHYSEGRYCDYPAEVVMSAVNAEPLTYNPTAFPIKIGFLQSFTANFPSFAYLSKHRSASEIEAFLQDPNNFVKEAGIKTIIPFDEFLPKIMAAMLEDDMYKALISDNCLAVGYLTSRFCDSEWSRRHPERYPKTYMQRESFAFLKDLPHHIFGDDVKSSGLSQLLDVSLLHIRDFFSE